jgi:hypothetical protein
MFSRFLAGANGQVYSWLTRDVSLLDRSANIAAETKTPTRKPELGRTISSSWQHKNKPYPDDFEGIRNKINELVSEIKDNKDELNKLKSNPWTWEYWENHKAKLTIILFVLSGLWGAAWYVHGLVLDSHIDSAIRPLQEQTTKLDGDIKSLTGIVEGLKLRVSALRFTAIPAADPKSRIEELKKFKITLTKTPQNTPEYWPVAFQIITLLSKATSPVEPKHSLIDVNGAHWGGDIQLSPGECSHIAFADRKHHVQRCDRISGFKCNSSQRNFCKLHFDLARDRSSAEAIGRSRKPIIVSFRLIQGHPQCLLVDLRTSHRGRGELGQFFT